MDGSNLGLNTKEFLPLLLCNSEEVAIGDGLPSLVSTLANNLVGTSQTEDSLALVGKVILATLE